MTAKWPLLSLKQRDVPFPSPPLVVKSLCTFQLILTSNSLRWLPCSLSVMTFVIKCFILMLNLSRIFIFSSFIKRKKKLGICRKALIAQIYSQRWCERKFACGQIYIPSMKNQRTAMSFVKKGPQLLCALANGRERQQNVISKKWCKMM